MNRFKQALMSQSACNVSGLAHSLVDMIKEVRDEDVAAERDPAVALVAYQIGYLCRVSDIHMTTDLYARLLGECERRSSTTTKEATS